MVVPQENKLFPKKPGDLVEFKMSAMPQFLNIRSALLSKPGGPTLSKICIEVAPAPPTTRDEEWGGKGGLRAV